MGQSLVTPDANNQNDSESKNQKGKQFIESKYPLNTTVGYGSSKKSARGTSIDNINARKAQ